MYLIINNNKHTVSKRVVLDDTIKYLTVTPTPTDISGTIKMYRDDDFLMCEDNADSFERKLFTGTLLILTNKPEVVPEPYTPPEAEPDVWDELAAAITEGVNEV